MATFMGKPWNDDEGSGFHLHLSIVDEASGEVLAAPDDQEGELSPLALQYIAGVLAHAPRVDGVLQPDRELLQAHPSRALVPTRVNWGHDNRFTLVRVPPERGSPHAGRSSHRRRCGQSLPRLRGRPECRA